MKTLVTGVAGYIGSHVAEELLSHGHTVYGIDDLSTGFFEFVDSRIKFSRTDLRSPTDLEKVIAEFASAGCDSIVHCAGIKYAGESVTNPLRFYEINVTGTSNLLRLIGKYKIKYFVFPSSCSVYGEPVGQEPISEESILLPVSPYGRSKLFAEKLLRTFPRLTTLNS